MSVYSALLLAAAGFAAADSLAAMNIGEAHGRNITVAGPGAAPFGGVHSVSDGCGIGMTTCDVNCMPLTGICCGLGNGAYCDIGYSCVDNGCCPVGKVCSGPATGCEGDRDLCGEFCVPKGTCDGSGGGGSGGGSGSGSGGCPSGYEACDDECMPTGSVCCHNGYHCNAGQTCTSDFKCRRGGGGGSSGGGGGGGGDGGDEPTTSIDDSFTSRGSGGSRPTSYSLSPDPEPTAAPTESNPFGGDDVSSTEDSQPTATEPSSTEDSQPSASEPSTTPRPTSNRAGGSGSGSGGNGSSNGGSNGDDDGNNGNSGNNGGNKNGGSGDASNGDSNEDDGSSGTINAPSIIVGVLALVAFVL